MPGRHRKGSWYTSAGPPPVGHNGPDSTGTTDGSNAVSQIYDGNKHESLVDIYIPPWPLGMTAVQYDVSIIMSNYDMQHHVDRHLAAIVPFRSVDLGSHARAIRRNNTLPDQQH